MSDCKKGHIALAYECELCEIASLQARLAGLEHKLTVAEHERDAAHARAIGAAKRLAELERENEVANDAWAKRWFATDQERLALKAECDDLQRQSANWRWNCGCALDTPDDVCLAHSPIVTPLKDRLAKAAKENDALSEMLADRRAIEWARDQALARLAKAEEALSRIANDECEMWFDGNRQGAHRTGMHAIQNFARAYFASAPAPAASEVPAAEEKVGEARAVEVCEVCGASVQQSTAGPVLLHAAGCANGRRAIEGTGKAGA